MLRGLRDGLSRSYCVVWQLWKKCPWMLSKQKKARVMDDLVESAILILAGGPGGSGMAIYNIVIT